jgi:translation initiation factor 5
MTRKSPRRRRRKAREATTTRRRRKTRRIKRSRRLLPRKRTSPKVSAPLLDKAFLLAPIQHPSPHVISQTPYVRAGSNGGEDAGSDYIKNALLGKSSNGELHGAGDEEGGGDDSSDASEAGVDDAGARVLAVEATKAYLASNPSASAGELVEFVTNQQMASALKSQERVYIAVRAAFTPSFFKDGEVAKYAPALSKITNGKRIMERHLIAALEAHCADKPKNFPVFIKQLYDEDALEEEAILEWADEGRSDYTLEEVDEETRAVLRSEAEPVVVWLQDADSDTDDDDDDDGGDDE